MKTYNFYGDKNKKKYFDEGGEFETHEEAESFADRMKEAWDSDVTFYAKDNPDEFFFSTRPDKRKCDYCGCEPDTILIVDLKNHETAFCCNECVDENDKIINSIDQ